MSEKPPVMYRIVTKIADFNARMSVRPTKLYVGAVEFEELREDAESQGFIIDKSAVGDMRAEYRGMKIYPVDEDNYLGVGE